MIEHIVTNDNWKYTTEEGFYLKKDDVITDNLYLGKGDSIDNWEVITEEQKLAFEEEKKKAEENSKDSPDNV